MDVARDLVDHQLVDRDGRECGRVDDVWIEWEADGARLGPLMRGTATMLDQLGAAGRLLQHVGNPRAGRSQPIEWARVARVERSRVLLTDPPSETARTRQRASGARRYSAIARLPVIDAADERRGVLDLRTQATRGGAAPAILGLIVCRRTWLRTLGMKRYDAAGIPLADIQDHARFVPWNAVTALGDAIHLGVAFADLPRLGDAPDPGPPPLAPAPEKP